MDSDYALVLDKVSKSFKTKIVRKADGSIKKTKKTIKNTILDSMSLDIKKGDVVGILGRNGSGKSTLLKLIARIMEPDSGTISVNGKVASILELGMGFHSDMSGRENIYLKSELYGFSKSEIDRKIDDIIAYSGIDNYIDYPVRTYSSGMVARLAFAILVNVDADILLVDEVLSVGDVSFSTKAFEHFKRISKSGKTVLIVSHSIYSIEQMCNRAIWIEKGKIIQDGDAKRVCSIYQNEMSESFEIISDFAMSGIPDAQYKYAIFHRDGIGCQKNYEMYKEWIKKSSDQGYPRAQIEYGEILLSEGGDDNKKEALYLFQSAANKGSSEARVKISTLMGGNSDNSHEDLINEYKIISDKEGSYWKRLYAELLLKISRNDNDRQASFDAYLDSANTGDIYSMNQVATMYRDGNGVARNLEKMEKYYYDSAIKGNQYSMVVLANMLLEGKLLQKDESRSFDFFLRAAKLGNSNAEYQVAKMFSEGIGTEIDEDKAKEWYSTFSNSQISNYYYWLANYLSNGRGPGPARRTPASCWCARRRGACRRSS